MKMILVAIPFGFMLFAVAASADPKGDYFAAISACAAANPPPVTDARIACDKAAMDAYNAARSAPQAPAQQAPAKK